MWLLWVIVVLVVVLAVFGGLLFVQAKRRSGGVIVSGKGKGARR